MISLRPYQSQIIEEVREHLRAGRKRILIQLQTGGGKTAIAGFIAKGVASANKNLWMNCHRDFLLDQTSKTFDSVGINHGFIAAGLPFNQYRKVQICGVGTLTRRLDRLTQPDYIIWDETKHIAAASWNRVFEWAPDAVHIGLDATPWRLDGRGLGDYYEVMVQGPTVTDLISQGYLSGYRAFAPSAPNLSGVHIIAGDYNRGELGQVMDDGQIIGDMVRHYREKANGKRAVYFAVSVEHSKHIAATFTASGIPAVHIDGTTNSEDRRRVAVRLAAGDLQIISNVDIACEGFDLSAQAGMDCPIECVGIARPTQSLSLHLQQIGRALRPKPDGSPAIILDHAGNLLKHGLPDNDREWSLEGRQKAKRSGDAGPPVRQCERCFGVHAAAAHSCPYCGHVHVIEGRQVEEVAGELVEINATQARREQKREVGMAQTREALQAIARERGYKPSWVDYIMAARAKKGARGSINRYGSISD